MKTRTLLLMSVGTALAILLAGGVFLVRLAGQRDDSPLVPIGESTEVGDVRVTVLGATEADGTLVVDVEIGGLDDPDGIDSFRLVTGDRRLAPLGGTADGRCGSIRTEVVTCRVDFDVGAAEGPSRVLVMRRGDEQANWRLDRSG